MVFTRMEVMNIDITPEQFKLFCDIEATCWIWKGFQTSNGYGRLSVKGKEHAAHRLSFQLFKEPIPSGMLVCHTCDTPLCVNPSHLFLGTNQSNSDDKIAKERGSFKGDKAQSAKLTFELARSIREQSKITTPRMLAEKYEVSLYTIRAILAGRRWAEVV